MKTTLLWGAAMVAACALGVQCDCCWPGDCDHPVPGPSCDNPQPAPLPLSSSPTLQGFVDLHTHPMSNIGFAGGLVSGGVDEGALLPLDPDCKHDVEAGSVDQALGHCGSTHDGNIDNSHNPCGDSVRALFVTALDIANGANSPPPDSWGYPYFDSWPKWNEVSHQIMWVDWIKRAYLGGLRVMVALAVNNKTIADVVNGTSPVDPLHPDDDMGSADQQILRLKEFVGRHTDFMGIAYTADDLKALVQGNKLAVLLGLEVDNIGNFNQNPNVSEADVHREIVRLYGNGVRYLFPIHVIDNPFGTAAYYQDLFDVSNYFEDHHQFMHLECADAGDQIDQRPAWCASLSTLLDPFQNLGKEAEVAAAMLLGLKELDVQDSPFCPSCATLPNGKEIGLVNRGVAYPGLTPLGKFAIQDMMRQGILIDVDHMSQASTEDTLALALQENYPVNSGHNQLRVNGGSERNMAPDGYAKIGQVHGMAGVGVNNFDEIEWIDKYKQVIEALGGPDAGAVAGFGTDSDGVSALMKPPPSPDAGLPALVYDDAGYPQSGLGQMCWDYNKDGVAHYGLLSDLVKALPQADGGAFVQGNLMQGAQYFYDTWKLAEAYKAAHALDDAGIVASSVHVAQWPVCDPPRVLDKWGTCALPALPRALFMPEPTPEAMSAPVVMPTGAYMLHLEAQMGQSGRQVRDFSLPLTATGRALVLGSQPAGGGAVVVRGGFRSDRFVMHLGAGTQRLVLLAIVPEGRELDEVRGAFASSAPGVAGTRGAFRLSRLTPDAGAPATSEPLNGLSSFLESLSEQAN